MKTTNDLLCAAHKERDLAFSVPLEIEAAASPEEGQKPKPRRFTMNAYNGGAMQLKGFFAPVVIDLAGIQGTDRSRPALLNHDFKEIVGHIDKIDVTGSTIKASGLISGGGKAAQNVLAAADSGFPWQASVGARALSVEYVREGVTATANGKTFTGPINIARKSVLGEISFVPLGADDTTSARIAARAAEGIPMDFQEWLKAKGFVLADLDDAQRASLQAMFDSENSEAEKTKESDASDDSKNIKAEADDGQADPTAELRASAAAESRRIAAIAKACGGKFPDIEAKAIEEGWDVTKAELEVLRAERPKAPAIHAKDNTLTGDVLEAAAVLAGGLSEVGIAAVGGIRSRKIEEIYGEKTLEAADKRFRHGIGLQEMILEAAWANGYTGRNFRQDPVGAMRAAFTIQASGFSTVSLPGIFSNTANKFLLAGYMNVERVWSTIAATRPVNDFKTVTSYRLTADAEFEEVGPDGELKHGTLGEESFTNRAKTYGKMFGINRQDIINDDLGALTSVPRKIGRGSALKLNKVFWTEFMNNSTFFASGNKNYISGATSALSIDGLTLGEQKFMDQTDPQGNPLGATPAILLVPTALNVTAANLMNSTEIRNTTSSTKYGTNNPHAGKFRTATSAYLSNTGITGNSTTAWYLLSDPNDIPVIEVAFLNGRQQPTVESADADFNVLGIQMRGYFDFGVSKQDYRGGVKSAGA